MKRINTLEQLQKSLSAAGLSGMGINIALSPEMAVALSQALGALKTAEAVIEHKDQLVAAGQARVAEIVADTRARCRILEANRIARSQKLESIQERWFVWGFAAWIAVVFYGAVLDVVAGLMLAFGGPP